MKTTVSFKLVDGFHKETPVPKIVRTAGLTFRLAIVQDSYVPESADMYFDSALLLGFLQTVEKTLAAKTCKISLNGFIREPITELHALSDLNSYYLAQPGIDREMPKQIQWLDEERIVAMGFPEVWYSVGGPAIYHDSFTFSVFSKQHIFSEVASIYKNSRTSHGAILTSTIVGHSIQIC